MDDLSNPLAEPPAERQFLACTFNAGGRAYSYHNDGPPLAKGDRARVLGRNGAEQTVTVEWVMESPPPFETKPILGLADLASAAPAKGEQ